MSQDIRNGPGPTIRVWGHWFYLVAGGRAGDAGGAVSRLIFIALELLIDGAVGLAAGRLGSWLSRRRSARQAVDIGSRTIMVALAGRLALER
jgi:threonine/homoserine/homoserine lactone efflux protein